MYEEKKEFNVLKGRVSRGKVNIIAKIDGEVVPMPEKEVLFMESLKCDQGIKGSWDYKAWKITTEESIKNSTCTISFLSPKTFAEYIEYKRNIEDTIESLRHEETHQTPELTDYRYTGSDPNNYVCFGSEENPCPEENLYRIIGVIPTQNSENGAYENRVKLIKEYYYTESKSGFLLNNDYGPNGFGYRWNENGTNRWENSTLNINVLNKVYWNSLEEYQQYIDLAKWYLGAPNGKEYNNYSSRQYYSMERSNTKGYSQGSISYLGKIGLMYPSDYGYAIGKTYRDVTINSNKDIYSTSWLFFKEYTWCITPESMASIEYKKATSFCIHKLAHISWHDVSYLPTSIIHVHPTFYLKENVKYKKGDGKKENPYYIFI